MFLLSKLDPKLLNSGLTPILAGDTFMILYSLYTAKEVFKDFIHYKLKKNLKVSNEFGK